MKRNIEYYPHYVVSDQHPKFKVLRAEYGWAGEGKFWALNNRIGQAENCCLDVSKKYNKAAVAVDLGFTIPEFDKFMSFLQDDCELIVIQDGTITTDIIQDSFEKAMSGREKARKRALKRLPKQTSASTEKVDISPEKTYRVDEKRVDEKKKDYTDDFESFWGAYPNKKCGKKNAFKSWEKQSRNRPAINIILDSISGHKKTQDWQKENGQFIPMATTWINQNRWDAELSVDIVPQIVPLSGDDIDRMNAQNG